MPRPQLDIVVPVLDEEDALRKHLPALRSFADTLIVSDGGSTDGSAVVAVELGARVVSSPPGRGVQLNRGAAVSRAEILLFVHADTALPPEAPERVRQAIAAGAVGGGFNVRFDVGRPPFRLGGRLINLRTRLTRLPLGDQAQFASRAAFDRLGGFRDWPILEDLDFMRRLKRLGPVAILDPPVVTAARRFVKRGIARTVATNWLIWALYLAGVSPHRLARLYRKVR